MCLVYSKASLLCQSQKTRQRWIYSETVIAHVPGGGCAFHYLSTGFDEISLERKMSPFSTGVYHVFFFIK